MRIYVNIDVDDIDKGIAFYTAIGLTLARRLFDGTVAELTGATAPIHLLPRAARNYTRHWTPVHLDFCVDDLDAAIQRALATGAILEGAVRSYDWGRIATLGDPFGHGLCLMQLAPGGYDHAAG
jgi:predicted enzyme related to lactoylglutathione lyase